jgi:enoyl-CoA hydratase/carnithine racemase
MSEFVHYGVGDQVATLTLDSPRSRNALSRPLLAELTGRLADAVADPSVRAVVITHAGRVHRGEGRRGPGDDLPDHAGPADPPTRGRQQRLAEESAAMAELSARLFASAEAQEGIHAFLEKRPPAWRVS